LQQIQIEKPEILDKSTIENISKIVAKGNLKILYETVLMNRFEN
jgi:hypothetical protein